MAAPKQMLVVQQKADKKPKKSHKSNKFKVDFKKEGMNAGLGALVGLGIKYGIGYLTRNNEMASEITRRAANVAAAYAGHGTGELAYQAIDSAINYAIIIPSGGTPSGGQVGEFA